MLLLNRLKGKNTDNQIETNLIEESKKFELKKEPKIEIIEQSKIKLEEPKEDIKEEPKTNDKDKIYLQEELIFHIKLDNNTGDGKDLFQDEKENKIVFFFEDLSNYQNASHSCNKSKKTEDLSLGRNRIKINVLDRDNLKKNRSFKKVPKKEEKGNNQPTFKLSIKEKRDIFGIKGKKTNINERTNKVKKIEKKDVVKTLSKGTSIIPNQFPFKF